MRRLLLAFAAPAVLLAGCSTTTSGSDLGAPVAADSAYGMFLAGAAALNEGRNGDAAKFLDLARTESGDDPAVAERAFTAALMAERCRRRPPLRRAVRPPPSLASGWVG